jgi:hypothetical protein
LFDDDSDNSAIDEDLGADDVVSGALILRMMEIETMMMILMMMKIMVKMKTYSMKTMMMMKMEVVIMLVDDEDGYSDFGF